MILCIHSLTSQQFVLIRQTSICNLSDKASILKFANFMHHDFRFDPESHVPVAQLNCHKISKGLQVRAEFNQNHSCYHCSALPVSTLQYVTVWHPLMLKSSAGVSRSPGCRGKKKNRFTSNWRDVWNNYQMTAGAAAESRRQSKWWWKWKTLIECQRESAGHVEPRVMRCRQLKGTPPRMLCWEGRGGGADCRGRGVVGMAPVSLAWP